MQPSLQSLCLTHHNASVELRGLFALSDEEVKEFLLYLKDIHAITEALVVSTCNRTEIYYVSEEDLSDKVLRTLIAFKGNADLEGYTHLFQKLNHSASIQHLFEVYLGLDSQILGDIQIANQIKKAYQTSADVQMAGAFLHRLLHSVFYTNKRVAQETSFKDGAASTAYAAVELLEEISFNMQNPKILVMGLGEIGADICRNLQGRFSNVSITNRTRLKAESLALECGFEVLDFENIWQHIQEADIIISSVATKFISKEQIIDMPLFSYKYFIDLSVPRSVCVDVEEVAGCILYDIDHLQAKTNETLQRRQKEAISVRNIITESISEFENWAREMEISPTIHKLKMALEQLRKEEISKYSKKATEHEIELLDKVTGNLVQKIIKMPVLQLKAACKRGEAETLIDVLNDLFNLEKMTEIKQEPVK